MPSKSPSKFFSIKKLMEIRDNDYSNADKNIDYVPDEVNEMLWEKQNKTSEKEYSRYIKSIAEKEEIDLLNQGLKKCNLCKQNKKLKEFSLRSGSESKRRSYCNKCRANKNKIYGLPF